MNHKGNSEKLYVYKNAKRPLLLLSTSELEFQACVYKTQIPVQNPESLPFSWIRWSSGELPPDIWRPLDGHWRKSGELTVDPAGRLGFGTSELWEMGIPALSTYLISIVNCKTNQIQLYRMPL